MAWEGLLPWRHVPGYLVAQVLGAFAGVAAAHGMFALPLFMASQHGRSGPAQLWSEGGDPFAAAAYIMPAY